MFFLIVLFILFLAPLVLSLVFFVRYLITKKSGGCGIFGLVFILFVALIVGSIYFLETDMSDRRFINEFEDRTALMFPVSGVITDKGHNAWHLDRYFEMIIKMDSVDFMHILHKVQEREVFTGDFLDIHHIGRRLSVSDFTPQPFSGTFALYEEHEWGRGRRFRLLFRDDMRSIRVVMYDV
jgi:hypothetical protein